MTTPCTRSPSRRGEITVIKLSQYQLTLTVSFKARFKDDNAVITRAGTILPSASQEDPTLVASYDLRRSMFRISTLVPMGNAVNILYLTHIASRDMPEYKCSPQFQWELTPP